MKIVVRDNLGNDVTNEREWYINTEGKIFYYTGDIDEPLYVVDNDYIFEVVPDGYASAVSEEDDIRKYPFFVSKESLERLPKADTNKIDESKKRIEKYIKKV